MGEYVDVKTLHRALATFGTLKERSFISLRKLICDWVRLYNGYPNAICEFTDTQMRVTVDSFTLVNYDFKHRKEVFGRLQTIGIDAESIDTIKMLFQMLNMETTSSS